MPPAELIIEAAYCAAAVSVMPYSLANPVRGSSTPILISAGREVFVEVVVEVVEEVVEEVVVEVVVDVVAVSAT